MVEFRAAHVGIYKSDTSRGFSYIAVNKSGCRNGRRSQLARTFWRFDEDPHLSFPEDSDFMEILPDEPWQFEFILEKESPSHVDGLEYLELDRTYNAQIATDLLRGFSSWMFGRKKDSLNGSLEGNKRQWEINKTKIGSIKVDPRNEPVALKDVK
ncbi:uncharacterized protein K460DRAFT_413891 [Cucurbitaria berberidis CBS 394.84]|uniref:Uncharacterized protein n=1 Tax=Cucurbitaria berberidis CBS 394.84 TaxID=1168544 RepID=A0A9P4L9J4_9PLEO|nr:uncharacterized protein K460DRAFT_413891 [Cucurbitaria berberidis CBS 394.84]KAF1847085.1 hypothetical protein K460DRAFT_413891 [Cucurbitaria berberidis CBS 394.84]